MSEQLRDFEKDAGSTDMREGERAGKKFGLETNIPEAEIPTQVLAKNNEGDSSQDNPVQTQEINKPKNLKKEFSDGFDELEKIIAEKYPEMKDLFSEYRSKFEYHAGRMFGDDRGEMYRSILENGTYIKSEMIHGRMDLAKDLKSILESCMKNYGLGFVVSTEDIDFHGSKINHKGINGLRAAVVIVGGLLALPGSLLTGISLTLAYSILLVVNALVPFGVGISNNILNKLKDTEFSQEDIEKFKPLLPILNSLANKELEKSK